MKLSVSFISRRSIERTFMRKVYLMYLVEKITTIDSFLGQFCIRKDMRYMLV